MPRFAANLTLLFDDAPFLDRFRRAADAGFAGVECQFPYAYDPRDLKRKLDEHGLVQVLHNLPAGDWDRGERGIACLPDRVGEFETGVDRALEYAGVLGCRQLNCLAGIPPSTLRREDARATFVENLRYASRRCRDAGIALLVEPINTRDVPGFLLSTASEAIGLIEAVDSENLFLQFDAYHAHVMNGDVLRIFQEHSSRIAHVQIADDPGRHEPGTGEIPFDHFLELLDHLGYPGWVGCEYIPRATTESGLAWMNAYRT